MLEFSRRGFAALCVGALVLGWVAVPPSDPAAVIAQARRDVWSPPELPRPEFPAGNTVALAAAPMWGPDAKPGAAPPPEDTRWRLAGLWGHGKVGGAVLIFMDPAKPVQRLKVGDKLPEGQEIVMVEGQELVVRNAKKKLERLLVERTE